MHLAACAGSWQALLFGFLGAEVRDGVLQVRPRLPRAWPVVEVAFACLGRRVRLRVDPAGVTMSADGPLRARLGEGRASVSAAGRRTTGRWTMAAELVAVARGV